MQYVHTFYTQSTVVFYYEQLERVSHQFVMVLIVQGRPLIPQEGNNVKKDEFLREGPLEHMYPYQERFPNS